MMPERTVTTRWSGWVCGKAFAPGANFTKITYVPLAIGFPAPTAIVMPGNPIGLHFSESSAMIVASGCCAVVGAATRNVRVNDAPNAVTRNSPMQHLTAPRYSGSVGLALRAGGSLFDRVIILRGHVGQS